MEKWLCPVCSFLHDEVKVYRHTPKQIRTWIKNMPSPAKYSLMDDKMRELDKHLFDVESRARFIICSICNNTHRFVVKGTNG